MRFSTETIRGIQRALVDDAAGNKPCTMTDLDMAVKMLERLIEVEEREDLRDINIDDY